jgi:hypothetical protein
MDLYTPRALSLDQIRVEVETGVIGWQFPAPADRRVISKSPNTIIMVNGFNCGKSVSERFNLAA